MSFLLNTVNKVNDTFAKAGSFNSEFGMSSFSSFNAYVMQLINFFM